MKKDPDRSPHCTRAPDNVEVVSALEETLMALLLDEGLVDTINTEEGLCHTKCRDVNQHAKVAGNPESTGVEDPVPVCHDHLGRGMKKLHQFSDVFFCFSCKLFSFFDCFLERKEEEKKREEKEREEKEMERRKKQRKKKKEEEREKEEREQRRKKEYLWDQSRLSSLELLHQLDNEADLPERQEPWDIR